MKQCEVCTSVTMSSDEVYSKLKGLCFVEDAFRCICFFDSARKCNMSHVCSIVADWEAILQLATDLISSKKLSNPLHFDLYISDFITLYQTICSIRNCNVMPWVSTKLQAHVEFFMKLEPMVSVKYDSEIGFRVIWEKNPSFDDVKSVREYEYQDPPPNFAVPLAFLNNHSEFGPQHPITVRTWDYESSNTDVEIILGIFALFNSCCPKCKNIEVFRFPRESPQLHEIGYARLTFINIQSILKGDELCFPYRSNWFEQSGFPCMNCHQEPTSVLWISDRRSFEDFQSAFFLQRLHSKETYLSCVDWLVLDLDKKMMQSGINHSKSFCVSVLSFVAWIVNSFALDTGELASLVSGLIIHRLQEQNETEIQLSNHRSDLKEFFALLFPRYGQSLFKLFSFIFTFDAPNVDDFNLEPSFESEMYYLRHDLCASLLDDNHLPVNDTVSHSFSIDTDDFQLALEECMILKILGIRDQDIDLSRFSLCCLKNSLDIVVGNFVTHNPLDQVRLMFALIACSPMRPTYLDLISLSNTRSTHRVKFETIKSFVSCGIYGSTWFPNFPLDMSHSIANLVSSNIEGILDGQTISDFGGHISFLLRKCAVKNNPSIKKLAAYFEEVHIRRMPHVGIFYEDYFNAFINDDAFFSNGDENDDREGSITQFIYWCLSQSPSLDSMWISRLSQFGDSLQIDLCFGRFDKDPLNLWTILVYLCNETNAPSIQIGSDVFNVFEFTKKFVISRIRRAMLIDDPACECDVAAIYFLTHVVYVVTDYCNLEIPAELFQKTNRLWSLVFHRFCDLLQCPFQTCFVECICEVMRNIILTT